MPHASAPHIVTPHVLYGAPFSYYSGKARSYLLHKRIPFVEKQVNAWTYLVQMRRRTGAAVVPVVRTPDGAWLQDSSVIIDTLERQFPAAGALPDAPVLRFAAYLFELWGDEFLLPLAMHTRWNRPAHIPWYVAQAGAVLLPGWPAPAQRFIGRRIAGGMSGLAPVLGFDAAMAPLLERFGQIQLDGLDAHFAAHRFLFGDRPSLGDYGLVGPLYAHIGRDPLSRRDLIDCRPHLGAWIARMFDPDSARGGDFLACGRVPDTLWPALRSIFDEMTPFLAACADQLRATAPLPSGARPAPRFLGQIQYPLAGGVHRRQAASYPVWMARRMLDAYQAMPDGDRAQVSAWLASAGGGAVLALDLPPVARAGLAAAHVRVGHAA